MGKDVGLEEFLDFRLLQQIQDGFAAIANIALVVLGPKGEKLTRASYAGKVGQALAMDAYYEQLRARAERELLKVCAESGRPAALVCRETRLAMVMVPVTLEGQLIGCWAVEQVRLPEGGAGIVVLESDTPESVDRLREIAGRIPELMESILADIVSFLQIVGFEFIKIGYAKVRIEYSNTVQQRAVDRMDTALQTLYAFVDGSGAGIYLSDYETGELLLANKIYADMFGLDVKAVAGRKCYWYTGEGPNNSFCSHCPREKLVDENGQPTGPYTWDYFFEDRGQWMRCVNQAMSWRNGRLAHIVTFFDVTAEHQMQEELERLAYYDRQMALPNSLKLLQDVEQSDNPGKFLVGFDVISLRRVNDVYGRETGDALLAAMVEWVEQQGFAGGTLYRVDGDAFSLLFEGCNEARANDMGQEIFDRFQEAWVLKGKAQYISVLCGVSVAVVNLDACESGESILAILERTLELSRQEGEVACYDEEMDKASKERIRLELSLKHCIKNDMKGFEVHFQPIVEPAVGKWRGLEALCRWTNPEGGPVPPMVFIPEAEKLGLIRKLGMWVLETAMRHCKEWKLDEVEGFFLSVNMSPDQVMDENLVGKVQGLLDMYNYPGDKLNLEVTESTEFTFNSYSMNVIDRLRFKGVRFALDDFGTGYSSFNSLKNLPVSLLKTEREFIRGIENDRYMKYLFYTMAELAHAADMRLIAEGIETRQQLEIVLKNGADYIQGYYFSKPLAPDQMARKLDCFVNVDPAFYVVSSGVMTKDLLYNEQETYPVSPALFRLLNRSMQVLLTELDMNSAFDQVLEMVSEHFGVRRAYIFVRGDESAEYHVTNEWCGPGTMAYKNKLDRVDMMRQLEHWLPALEADGMIVAADAEKLPQKIYEVLEKRGMRSVAALPMYSNAELVGFVGFESDRYREWLPEEVIMLRNLGMTMADTIARECLQQELMGNNRRFSDVLNSMDMLVMAIDPASREVLWANESADRLFGQYVNSGPMAGQKCYYATHMKNAPCEFCRMDSLLEDPPVEKCAWELYHPGLGMYFMVYDSMVHWAGNRKVLLEYAMDITDVKRTQKQLEHFASTDALTCTFNRNSLILALRTQLKDASLSGRPLSVVFVDIDGLKQANDTYGHAFGDELIKGAVNAIRESVRSTDLMGRYGGDEFIVLLPNCSGERTTELMENARRQMENIKAGPFEDRYTFSYGVVENTELPYQDSDRVVNAVINLADDRMRDYKKAAKLGLTAEI